MSEYKDAKQAFNDSIRPLFKGLQDEPPEVAIAAALGALAVHVAACVSYKDAPIDKAVKIATKAHDLLISVQENLTSPEQEEALAAAILRIAEMVSMSTTAAFKNRQKELQLFSETLDKKNQAKKEARKMAQDIATELWQPDTAQEIRLGDMADRVYRTLAAEGFAESLPGTTERIKEWIRPVAPDYARKGGRRRKTP